MERFWRRCRNSMLEEEDFETLGAKFGLSYKGAAALYYRTIQKIRKSIVVGGDKG